MSIVNAESIFRWTGPVAGVALIAFAVTVLVLPATGRAGASQPSLTVTPGPTDGAYHSGQTVTVSVGPNSYFTPLAKVNILECADPGGKLANLPTSVSSCDGTTIQGGTILINRDGSFSQSDYEIFSLPNAELGEQANYLPVCNATNACVLYVGQNQEDFSQPKLFSTPFTVGASVAGAGTGSTTSTTTQQTTNSQAAATSSTSTTAVPAQPAAVSTSATSDPPASDPSATDDSAVALANTGAPALLGWLAGVAGLFILSGSAGRRVLVRLNT